ncbi:SprT-like domain-containing protein [Acinetobacter pittii]|uniref:SprT-like domain-containing protein n=1 Tax=Acinetobacter pittii TaxID=48296 RepID=UPI0032618A37
MTATKTTYDELQTAYDFFNQHLFNNELPACLITLQREKRTLGYFSWNRFTNSNGEQIDELAMNPSYFGIRTIAETLSTLVHEQVHNWQFHFGKPSRNGYHNKEWAEKMEMVGLMPSNTGQINGNKTGQQMTHYIIKGGAFEKACKKLISKKFQISWYDRFPPVPQEVVIEKLEKLKLESISMDEDNEIDDNDSLPNTSAINIELLNFSPEEVNKSNRDKYKCPICGNQVWGKPNMKLKCGEDLCNDVELENCY